MCLEWACSLYIFQRVNYLLSLFLFHFPQMDSTSPANVWVPPIMHSHRLPLLCCLVFVSFTPSRSCPVISLFLLFPCIFFFYYYFYFSLCLIVCVRSKPQSWTLQRGSITGRGTLTKSVNGRRGGSRSRSACYRYIGRSQVCHIDLWPSTAKRCGSAALTVLDIHKM